MPDFCAMDVEREKSDVRCHEDLGQDKKAEEKNLDLDSNHDNEREDEEDQKKKSKTGKENLSGLPLEAILDRLATREGVFFYCEMCSLPLSFENLQSHMDVHKAEILSRKNKKVMENSSVSSPTKPPQEAPIVDRGKRRVTSGGHLYNFDVPREPSPAQQQEKGQVHSHPGTPKPSFSYRANNSSSHPELELTSSPKPQSQQQQQPPRQTKINPDFTAKKRKSELVPTPQIRINPNPSSEMDVNAGSCLIIRSYTPESATSSQLNNNHNRQVTPRSTPKDNKGQQKQGQDAQIGYYKDKVNVAAVITIPSPHSSGSSSSQNHPPSQPPSVPRSRSSCNRATKYPEFQANNSKSPAHLSPGFLPTSSFNILDEYPRNYGATIWSNVDSLVQQQTVPPGQNPVPVPAKTYPVVQLDQQEQETGGTHSRNLDVFDWDKQSQRCNFIYNYNKHRYSHVKEMMEAEETFKGQVYSGSQPTPKPGHHNHHHQQQQQHSVQRQPQYHPHYYGNQGHDDRPKQRSHSSSSSSYPNHPPPALVGYNPPSISHPGQGQSQSQGQIVPVAPKKSPAVPHPHNNIKNTDMIRNMDREKCDLTQDSGQNQGQVMGRVIPIHCRICGSSFSTHMQLSYHEEFYHTAQIEVVPEPDDHIQLIDMTKDDDPNFGDLSMAMVVSAFCAPSPPKKVQRSRGAKGRNWKCGKCGPKSHGFVSPAALRNHISRYHSDEKGYSGQGQDQGQGHGQGQLMSASTNFRNHSVEMDIFHVADVQRGWKTVSRGEKGKGHSRVTTAVPDVVPLLCQRASRDMFLNIVMPDAQRI